uniref:Telomeric single stranded DNA binding POT1/Cdc13 domain-containing protein n=1 Tax=Graphocephala atropunctata TaxID=36148 RepID=A0A1B6M2P6_9HEMI
MGKNKKMRQYATLSTIDHKMQFINTVAVINSISPTIKRNKLSEVVLEVSDSTMHNPGFVVKLQLDSELLSEFMVAGKRGSIVDLQEIKIIKNEGVVYGEVKEEEELKLYNDKGSSIKWYCDEELHPITDEVKCCIKVLTQWKKLQFTETPSSEDLDDDLRRSRLSNHELDKAVTPSSVPERDPTVKHRKSSEHSPDKKRNNIKHKNNSILNSPESNLTKIKHLPDLNSLKSASSRNCSVHILKSPERKSSVGKIIGLLKSNQKSSETKMISKESINKTIPISSRGSPKANEGIKSSPSRKDCTSEQKTSETKRTSQYFKNSSIERKQNSKPNNITESSKKSVEDSDMSSGESSSEESFKNEESRTPRMTQSKTENQSFRPVRHKQNISTGNIRNEDDSFKLDDKSSKFGNRSDINESRRNVHTELRKRHCTFDQSELGSSASKKSSQNINSPINKLIKDMKNLKKKSQSFISDKEISKSLEQKEKKIAPLKSNTKIPALNSSDSSVSLSDRSLDSSTCMKRDKPVVYACLSPDSSSYLNQVEPNTSHQRSKSQKITDKPAENKKKLTRSSLPKTNVPSSHPDNKFEKSNPIFYYLKALTTKASLRQVDLQSDISMCDLEEIDVPDKFHLQCKVISEFTLIEDNIQVVRVEDGSITKKTLVIPECSSWEGVIEMILNNPTVKENSPFVDIIIFDFNRMDRTVKVGDFFMFHNVMAVKFHLKYDPRVEADKRGELFFCMKGQYAYTKRIKPTKLTEKTKKLEDEMYKLEDLKAGGKSSLPTCSTVNTGISKITSSPEGLKVNYIHHEANSPNTQKRKLKDLEIEKEVETFKTPMKSNKKVQNSNGKNIDPQESNIRNVEKPSRINTTTSSDETILGETPGFLRELREIMQEESVIGLQLTSSEDIHLKNTGSEVTYSQFCREADEKIINCRTSTQEENISESEVPVYNEDVNQMEELNKMEPLVYCPSGSSLSSAHEAPQIDHKTVPKDLKCQDESSESLLHNLKSMPNPVVKLNIQLKTGVEIHNEEDRNNDTDNASVISNSSSVRVISSNSSELECKVVTNDKHGKEKKVGIHSLQSEVKNKVELNPLNPKKCISPKTISDKSDIEEIEVLSDNSSNNSLIPVGNNNTKIKQKKSTRSNTDMIVQNVDSNEQQSNSVVKRNIPESCFFKSSAKPGIIEEDDTNIVDENGAVKYLSYSRDQSLPFLNLSILNKLIYQNYLEVSVFIVSITPALTGSWREKCVKARCTNCDKLYNVYNAANNKYSENSSTAALLVGSHIVCPDSQCCNQILESPEFQISLEIKLRDGTPLTALIAAQHAEEVFGCTAQEAIKDEKQFVKVVEILKNLEKNSLDKLLTHMHLTRENICDPKSGSLYIRKLYI